MKHHPINHFYSYISRPIDPRARVVLALLVIPLLLTFTAPVWKISLYAPQYPGGLFLDIYTYRIEAGNNGQHLDEINNLNHYIGMAPINREALSDLDWIPFALGILGLWALRVAAIGDVRSLFDLMVLSLYVTLFSLGRFVYKLYVFGHNLDPRAPMDVDPFMPAVLGSKDIANFTTHSYPQLGSLYLGIFVLGIVALAMLHLLAGFRHTKTQRAAAAGP